jgi:hypothetical protein
MHLCDSFWKGVTYTSHTQPQKSYNNEEILSQASPQLSRILQGYRVMRPFLPGFDAVCGLSPLFNIRLLLNLPWDEIKKAICPLRRIIGENKGELEELFYATSNPTLWQQPHSGSIFWDLARGYLRTMNSILLHRLPWNFRQVTPHA